MFKAKRIDRDEFVEGYYFKTPLTDENSGIDSKFGWFFLSDCIRRHCISTENGNVYVIDVTTLQIVENVGEENLEGYFKENIEKGIIDFAIRASKGSNGIEFYIHPDGVSGKTLDFWIEGNRLISRNTYDGSFQIIKDKKEE